MRSLILVGSRSGGRRSNLRGTGTIDHGARVKRSALRGMRGGAMAKYSEYSGARPHRERCRTRAQRERSRGLGAPAARRTPPTGDGARVPRAALAHGDASRPPPRARRRRACTGSCAARRRGSCAPTDSARVVELGAQPAVARARRARARAASFWRSVIGSTIACTGASQTGSSPPRCSSRMPMKRSNEPNSARWIITGRCSALSAPM